MELIGGPAALGGIILGVALCGWSLGRWQGVMPPAVPSPGGKAGAAAAAEGSQPPRQARQHAEADDMVASLGTLHAEISAYRRAEQVLSPVSEEGREDMAAIMGAASPPRAPDAPPDADQPVLSVAASLTRV